jgi:hypothetical protein
MNAGSVDATASVFGTNRRGVQMDANAFLSKRRILRVDSYDVASNAWILRSNVTILRSNECDAASNECIVGSNERVVASPDDDVASADCGVVMDGDAVISAGRHLRAERRDVRGNRCGENKGRDELNPALCGALATVREVN